MIYFDNAATTFPKPESVKKSICNALTKFGGNPGRSGHKMSLNAAKLVYSMRETAAEFFGLNNAEQVILTKNCTEALNIAIFGIMSHGGNAIISHFEHNSVMRPLNHLKNKGICDYKVANISFENSNLTVNEFENLIDKDTKMIICTHASNVLGKLSPINELSKICKKHNIIFCVDASQTAGIININMSEQNIDILCAPGHKSLFGPTGTGLLLLGNKISTISPMYYGGSGSTSISLDMPDFLPDRLEAGTINVIGAAGLKAGLDFISKKGIKNIHSYENYLISNLYDRLYNTKGIILYSAAPSIENSVSTLSFNVKGKSCTDISSIFDSKNIALRSGLHCNPMAHTFLGTVNSGTVRVSLSIYNTIEEINYFCNILDKI